MPRPNSGECDSRKEQRNELRLLLRDWLNAVVGPQNLTDQGLVMGNADKEPEVIVPSKALLPGIPVDQELVAPSTLKVQRPHIVVHKPSFAGRFGRHCLVCALKLLRRPSKVFRLFSESRKDPRHDLPILRDIATRQSPRLERGEGPQGTPAATEPFLDGRLLPPCPEPAGRPVHPGEQLCTGQQVFPSWLVEERPQLHPVA